MLRVHGRGKRKLIQTRKHGGNMEALAVLVILIVAMIASVSDAFLWLALLGSVVMIALG